MLINAVREGFKALGTDLAGELMSVDIMGLNFFLMLFTFSSMPVLVWHTNHGVHSRRKDLTVTFFHFFLNFRTSGDKNMEPTCSEDK